MNVVFKSCVCENGLWFSSLLLHDHYQNIHVGSCCHSNNVQTILSTMYYLTFPGTFSVLPFALSSFSFPSPHHTLIHPQTLLCMLITRQSGFYETSWHISRQMTQQFENIVITRFFSRSVSLYIWSHFECIILRGLLSVTFTHRASTKNRSEFHRVYFTSIGQGHITQPN